jgi:hypothetical protein
MLHQFEKVCAENCCLSGGQQGQKTKPQWNDTSVKEVVELFVVIKSDLVKLLQLRVPLFKITLTLEISCVDTLGVWLVITLEVNFLNDLTLFDITYNIRYFLSNLNFSFYYNDLLVIPTIEIDLLRVWIAFAILISLEKHW